MTRLRKMMLEELERRNYSAGTTRRYIRFVERFAQHFGKSPDKLGPDHIRTYQAYLLKARKLEPGTVENHVAALRFLFIHTLHRHEFRRFLPYPRVRRKLPKILSRDEVARLIDASSSLFERALLMVLYGTGMRRSEIARLKLADIDSQRMVIRVEQGKGQKDRYVMLSPRLLEILREWWRSQKPKRWLFPSDIPGRHITRYAVEQACQEAHRASRLSKPVTPHSLRHAFAVHLLEQGTDIRRIQLLLGHRSLATTARYLRIATSKVCSTTSPFDLLPQPVATESKPAAPQRF